MSASLTADWQGFADRLGLEPLGPVPPDLPDAWLMRLEAQAEILGAATDDAAYRVVLGEPGEGEATFRGLARAWLYTDALEAALRDRLPAETGLRRRWLEVLHRHCVASRLDGDPEVVRLVTELEQTLWKFHAAEPADLSGSERERLRAMNLRLVPLAEACRPTLVALIKRRNELARAEGATDYFELAMAMHEAPWALIAPWLERLKDATEAPYARYLDWLNSHEATPVEAFWDLRAVSRARTLVPTERLAPVDRAILTSTDEALGLPALGVPHHLTVQPFGVGGICSVIDLDTDVRIAVESTRPRHTQLAILLHEYGHAVHATVMGRGPLPYHLRTLLLGEVGPLCEGLAVVFESLKSEPSWMATVTDGSPEELAEWARVGRMLGGHAVRYHMMATAFDRALYGDPDQDLDALYLRLQRDYLGLNPPAEAGCLWAAGPMVASYPCYDVCYVLADLVAYQLREALGGELWGNRAVGAFLAEHIWEPAATVSWLTRLERATGRSLDAEALIRELNRV